MKPTPSSSRVGWLIVSVVLAVAACASDDSTSVQDESSALDAPAAEPAAGSTPVPTTAGPEPEPDSDDSGSNDPAPPSLRTDLVDVILYDPANEPRLENFEPSAVPVDALPATEVLRDADETTVATSVKIIEDQLGDGDILVEALVESCRLIVTWALPHPDHVSVGVEEFPDVDCTVAQQYTLLFVVPSTGTNSEGTWDYINSPEVRISRRVGSYS